MTRVLSAGALLAAGLFMSLQFAVAQDKPAGSAKPAAAPTAKSADSSDAQAMCPVSGKPIDKKFSTKFEGKPVYFCCEKCKPAFEKDPTKYEAAVKAQWAAMAPLAIQVKCPGTDKKINAKISVEGDHGPVYFCCPSCKAAWEKDSSKMKAKLADCYTYQTMCPVMGEEIDPSASIERGGKTIYLCCNDCVKEFDKDPAKFTANVDQQIKKNKAAMEKSHAEKK